MENEDIGHEILIKDLSDLLEAAKKFDFHDFRGQNIAPKMALSERLLKIRQKTVDGEYDNN